MTGPNIENLSSDVLGIVAGFLDQHDVAALASTTQTMRGMTLQMLRETKPSQLKKLTDEVAAMHRDVMSLMKRTARMSRDLGSGKIGYSQNGKLSPAQLKRATDLEAQLAKARRDLAGARKMLNMLAKTATTAEDQALWDKVLVPLDKRYAELGTALKRVDEEVLVIKKLLASRPK